MTLAGGVFHEVARKPCMETGAVSRHYRHALELADDRDEQGSAVVALLARDKRRGNRVARPRRTAACRFGIMSTWMRPEGKWQDGRTVPVRPLLKGSK
jgi:hypothetical protein